MNANELADELTNLIVAPTPVDDKWACELIDEAAIMLRQQQAEIEALKAKYEPKPLTKEQEQYILDTWKQIQPHLFKEQK